jgi:hypothetical protein
MLPTSFVWRREFVEKRSSKQTQIVLCKEVEGVFVLG